LNIVSFMLTVAEFILNLLGMLCPFVLDTVKCLRSMTSTESSFINNNLYGGQCKINGVLPIDNMIALKYLQYKLDLHICSSIVRFL
jgi:hypothetical protein